MCTPTLEGGGPAHCMVKAKGGKQAARGVERMGESSCSRSSMRNRFCATLNVSGSARAQGRTSLSTSTSLCEVSRRGIDG
jgi:hypothetical protein